MEDHFKLGNQFAIEELAYSTFRNSLDNSNSNSLIEYSLLDSLMDPLYTLNYASLWLPLSVTLSSDDFIGENLNEE